MTFKQIEIFADGANLAPQPFLISALNPFLLGRILRSVAVLLH
jgi:hypothetical protein